MRTDTQRLPAVPGVGLNELPDQYPKGALVMSEECKVAPIIARSRDNESKLDGTWQETNCRETKCHTIQGSKLTWADNSVTSLNISGDKLSMVYNGEQMSANLVAGGQQLHWNDKDVWTRAGLEGKWREGRSNLVHTIKGNTLSAEGVDWQLQLKGPTSFMLDFHGTEMSALLDELCQKLNWSDGDVWHRVNYEP